MISRAMRILSGLLCLGMLLGAMACGEGQKQEGTKTEAAAGGVGQAEQAQRTGPARETAQGSQAEQIGKVDQDRPAEELLSAREAFTLAREAAGEWFPDAVLVEVNTFPRPPEPDGRGSCWKFEFNSAHQGEKLEVHIRKGKVFQTLTGKLSKMGAITGQWIDSPEAMRRAATQLSECSGKDYWLGLSMSGNRPVWRIKCSQGSRQQAWIKMDATTGEEIESWTAQ